MLKISQSSQKVALQSNPMQSEKGRNRTKIEKHVDTFPHSEQFPIHFSVLFAQSADPQLKKKATRTFPISLLHQQQAKKITPHSDFFHSTNHTQVFYVLNSRLEIDIWKFA